MSALILTLAAVALAAPPPTPILFVGNPAEAVDAIVQRTQHNPWETIPIRLDELVQDKGVLVIGAGQPVQCSSRKVGMHEIGERVELARSRLSRQQVEDARRDLEAGVGLLPCLDEQAEASQLAELFTLGGIVEIELERQDVAADHLRRALAFSPQLGCPAGQPRQLCDRFDTIVSQLQEAPRGSIKVGLGVQAENVYLDGRRASVQGGVIAVPAGRHLVQVVRVVEEATLVTSRDVLVSGGEEITLVNSSAIDDAVLREPDLAEHRGLLAALVETSFPGRQVYLWSGAKAWSLSGAELNALDDPSPDRSARRQGLLVSGLTAATAGLVVTGVGLTQYLRNDDLTADEAQEDSEVYLKMKATQMAGEMVLAEGAILTGLGVVAAGGAMLLGGGASDATAQLGVSPWAGGLVLTVQVRR